jgi:hypothetical protein
MSASFALTEGVYVAFMSIGKRILVLQRGANGGKYTDNLTQHADFKSLSAR